MAPVTVSSAGPDDLVLCLISGGGSALLAAPAEGVGFEDKQAINKALLRSGAAIGEMNCVRKHLSAIKGGRLAALCAPARVVTLVISDVPGDDPAVIASGRASNNIEASRPSGTNAATAERHNGRTRAPSGLQDTRARDGPDHEDVERDDQDRPQGVVGQPGEVREDADTGDDDSDDGSKSDSDDDKSEDEQEAGAPA